LLILCRFSLLVSNLKIGFSFRKQLELIYFNGGKLCVYVGELSLQCKLKCQTTKVVLQVLDLSAWSSMIWWNFYQRNAEGILSLTWRKSRCEGWKRFAFLFLYKISFYDRSDFLLVWSRNQITIASKASPSYKKRENKIDIKNTYDNMTFWKQEAIFFPFLLKENHRFDVHRVGKFQNLNFHLFSFIPIVT
jgi:hypothetical protein